MVFCTFLRAHIHLKSIDIESMMKQGTGDRMGEALEMKEYVEVPADALGWERERFQGPPSSSRGARGRPSDASARYPHRVVENYILVALVL